MAPADTVAGCMGDCAKEAQLSLSTASGTPGYGLSQLKELSSLKAGLLSHMNDLPTIGVQCTLDLCTSMALIV